MGLWGLAPGSVSSVYKKKNLVSLLYKKNGACIDCEIVRLWVLKPTAVTSAPKRKLDTVSVNIRRLVVSPFSFLNASGLTLLVKSTVACC